MRNNKGQFVKGFGFWSGKKRLNMLNEKNPAWKGNKVGYTALHDWIKKRLGKPNFCENCKSSIEKEYEWSNISGEYKRDTSDWKRLCIPCHRKIDSHYMPRGEKHHKSKLTVDKVIKIRKFYKTGNFTQKRLGEMYKVSKNAIKLIINRTNWKHI